MFEIGMPSMTYSGSLLALIDVPPRIRICWPDPGSPPFWVMRTPEIRPSIIWLTFKITPTSASVASMVATDPVIERRSCIP